jgi:toxin ParE1/3/4
VRESDAWEYSGQAFADLIDAAQHLDDESDSSGPGDRLLESAAEACDRIALFPRSGRSRDDLAPGLRCLSLTRFPFLMFYRVEGNGVEIVRILHQRRNIEEEFRKSR